MDSGVMGDGNSQEHRHGTLDCLEVVHRIYHFLDGELTEVTRVEIRQHLDACLACLEAFEFEAELRTFVAQRCREEAPASLRERIAKAIEHEALHPEARPGIKPI